MFQDGVNLSFSELFILVSRIKFIVQPQPAPFLGLLASYWNWYDLPATDDKEDACLLSKVSPSTCGSSDAVTKKVGKGKEMQTEVSKISK